jgi:hypothetical protein
MMIWGQHHTPVIRRDRFHQGRKKISSLCRQDRKTQNTPATMAESAILPPQQHSQPSRKGKKAWRKNVDVTDVQVGLDELTEAVIKGYCHAPNRSIPYRKTLTLYPVASLPKSRRPNSSPPTRLAPSKSKKPT